MKKIRLAIALLLLCATGGAAQQSETAQAISGEHRLMPVPCGDTVSSGAAEDRRLFHGGYCRAHGRET